MLQLHHSAQPGVVSPQQKGLGKVVPGDTHLQVISLDVLMAVMISDSSTTQPG